MCYNVELNNISKFNNINIAINGNIDINTTHKKANVNVNIMNKILSVRKNLPLFKSFS